MRKSISLLLALLGLFDSLYLLWIYTDPNRTMICMGTGCDAVRLSAYSHFHGVPTPVFGVAGYIVVALLIVAESLAPAALAIEVRYALAGATGFGFLFSVYLEYLQGFVIHAFCAWCVTSGLVMTALCALAIYNVVHAPPEADPPVQLAEVRNYFVVGVAALVIGVPAFYELATHGEPPPAPPPSPTETTAETLVRPDSHVAGNPHAAVTLVEFGDFECPICGTEEPVAEKVRAKYANRIRFVFRQFPLVHIHPFSQRMAEASECAGEQGKFWEAVHEIYSRQDDLSEDGLKHDAAAIGLDPGKFDQCMAGGAETARVNRDHADGVALGVVGTPTFFVGRRPLPGVPDLDDLSQAIDEELTAEGVELPSGPAAPAAPALTTAPAPKETKNPTKPESTPSPPAPAKASSEPAPSGFGLLGSSSGGALQSFSSGIDTCNENELTKKQPAVIHTDRLREILAGNPKPLFVDVRPAKEYAAGQIPGAINIPLSDLPKSWSTLPKDRIIVFYESGKSAGNDICASGRKAGSFMLEHGYAFDHVKVYQEGLAGWQKAGL
jgi:protein-disulfide isomerase/rhodanese-related sulfurtransferase